MSENIPHDSELTSHAPHASSASQDDALARAAQQRSDGNQFLVSGLGVGAIGVVGAVLGGAVCPVCVVATPALLGLGVFKRFQASRR